MRPRALDTAIGRLRRTHRAPGLSIILRRRGRRVLARGYGYRDVLSRRPATPNTVFGVGSVTKSFTALALLRLQEHGRLKLTDTVDRHLPRFRTPDPRWARRTQLQHLLTHTSGLPPLPTIAFTGVRSLRLDPNYDPEEDRRMGIDPEHAPIDTFDELVEYLGTAQYRSLGPPGRYFSYSNEGFALLGAVIERASGSPYERFLEEEILRPAQMLHTTFDTGILRRFSEVTSLHFAKTRAHRAHWVATDEWGEDGCMRAAGGLRSSAVDMDRFVELFLRSGRVDRERIVAAKSVESMIRPRAEILPGLHYGYGICVQPQYQGTFVVHNSGNLPGQSAAFAVFPKKGLAGVALVNAGGARPDRILSTALNFLLRAPPEVSMFEVPPGTPHVKPSYAFRGLFASGEGAWFRLRIAKGRLQLASYWGGRGAKPNSLASISPNEFVLGRRGREGYLRFERDSSGRIWAALWQFRLVRRRALTELRRAPRGGMIW